MTASVLACLLVGGFVTTGLLKLKSLPFELAVEDVYFQVDFDVQPTPENI